MRRRASLTVAVVAAAAVACGGGNGQSQSAPDPDRGQELFQANCAVCHGPGAQGTASGPPLVHEIYEPGHHSDEAFRRAVAEGSPAHHWDFGDMPPVPGLDSGQVDDIIAWVRQEQRAAGID